MQECYILPLPSPQVLCQFQNPLSMPATSPSAILRTSADAAARDARWDAFVSRHATPHFLQTTGWARLKSQFGWARHHVALERQDGSLLAGAQCLSIRRYGLAMGYIPRGPLVAWQDQDQSREVKERILDLARTQGWHFLTIEPDLEDLPVHREALRALGFQPSHLAIQPRSTIRVDLTVPDDELLARMKSKWRYNIRKAYRSGVRVRAGTIADLETFQVLLEETGRRQGFHHHSLAYYQAAFESLDASCLQLFLADVAGDTVAAIAVARVGLGAWYPWGASSLRHRQAMPNFALYHTAMLWAKEQGAAWYDLWGIPESLGALALQERLQGQSRQWPTTLPVALDRLPPRDLWTVYRMKQGFGGRIMHLVGAWDLPVRSGAYRLYRVGAVAQEHQSRLWNSLSSRSAAGNAFPEGAARQLGSMAWQTEMDGAVWDAAVGSCTNPHFMQSWAWGEQMARLGWRPLRQRLARKRAKCAGMAQILISDIRPRLPVKIADVPGGPILDWQDCDAALVFLEQLERSMRRAGVGLIRIAPNLRRDRATGLSLLSRLEDVGWRFSRSAWIHKDRKMSTGSESWVWPQDTLLAAGHFPEIKEGIVRYGTAADMERLSERRSFAADDLASVEWLFGRAVWMDSLQGNTGAETRPRSAFLLAEEPEAGPTAAALVVAWKDEAWFFRAPDTMLPHWACSGLQRMAIQWARIQGCTRLDWGPPPFSCDAGIGDWSPRPLIGTWSRLLWPLPERVSPGVLQCLERLPFPLFTMQEKILV